jgi:predicted ribosome quality control (RQC) complex YloA/Tae2 family protein
MPFDALVMRAVTHELERQLVGGRIRAVTQHEDAVFFDVATPAGPSLRVGAFLHPAWAHVRALREGRPTGRPATWMAAFQGSRIVACRQPAWERVWIWDLDHVDELGRRRAAELVFEWAGHLTNVVVVEPDGRVVDAFRRVAPGRPGRTIFPGHLYTPPPSVPDPCRTGQTADLPPWARRFGAPPLDELCRQWADPPWRPVVGLCDGRPEVWIAPWSPECRTERDWSSALADVFTRRRKALELSALRRRAEGVLAHRLEQVEAQIERAERQREDAGEAERWRALGDAVLAFGVPLGDDIRPSTWTDPTGTTWTLPWDEVDGGWVELARYCYQRYQKQRAAQAALDRLIPALYADRAALEAERTRLAAEDDPTALKRLVKPAPAGRRTDPLPYRRFVSARGMEIWVGRTAEENDALTFREARPDDLWFHVKQYPGSHVLLRCGKAAPHPEDIRDAAELAAYYSKAGRHAPVAVDYTPRKFVRRRPHGQPGQVFYTREKTLHVTPTPARLERLGAMSRALAAPKPAALDAPSAAWHDAGTERSQR